MRSCIRAKCPSRACRSWSPLLAAGVLLLLTQALGAQTTAPALPSKPGLYRQWYSQTTGTQITPRPYLVYLPQAYSAAENARQPLLMYLHGAGERGNNFFKLDANGPLRHAQDDPRFAQGLHMMVIYPQCPAGSDWTDPAMTDFVGELIDLAVAKLNADPDRVYLTGLSMGGTGTWHVGAYHASKFAAIMPICARAPEPQRLAQALQKVPAWIIVGGRDGDFTRDSQQMHELLRPTNNGSQITVFPNEGHGVWSKVYPNLNPYYTWLLRQKRSGAAVASTKPAAGHDQATTHPAQPEAVLSATAATQPASEASAQRATARMLAELIRDGATGEMPSWGYPLLARFPDEVLDTLTPCLAAPDLLTRERATVALGFMGPAAAPAKGAVEKALTKAANEREQRLLRWCLREISRR